MSSLATSNGPFITYQPLTEDIPLIPLPNDSGLRRDPHSPTGQRLNVSLDAKTDYLKRIRTQLNQLDGYGPFSPITFSVDGHIDLSTVDQTSIRVINIDPDSHRYGEEIPLDLGQGAFPMNNELGWFYGLTPSEISPTLLFPYDNQSTLNPQGVLSPLTQYEVSTGTLIIRPLRPLAHDAQHAVLITRSLQGWSIDRDRFELDELDPLTMLETYGPLRSPFPQKATLSQQDHIARALQLTGLTWADLAFGWTYTTGNLTAELDQVREGLYGRGTLSQLSELVPPELSDIIDTSVTADGEERLTDHTYILDAEFFGGLTELIGNLLDNPGYAVQFPSVDYFVFGRFKSPQFRSIDTPWLIDADGLQHTPQVAEIPFLLSVPKAGPAGQPPFPVVIYFHGTNSSRIESIILAETLAQQGIAVFAFDQVGHGPLIANIGQIKERFPQLSGIVDQLPLLIAQVLFPEALPEVSGRPFEEGIDVLKEKGLFKELAVAGRWEDRDQDQFHDPGEGFFSPNPLELCGALWQDVIDGMQAVRILRNLDEQKVPLPIYRPKEADVDRLMLNLLAGDFNADGVLDIGGPNVQISSAGTSLGGIHALLFAAFEAAIQVVTPIVPGGGMLDVILSSNLRFVAEPLFLSFFGQVVVGCPITEETSDTPTGIILSLGNDLSRCGDLNDTQGFARLNGDLRGTQIILNNQSKQLVTEGIIDERGAINLNIPSDRGDILIVSVLTDPPKRYEITARVNGTGYQPHSPDFRRAAMVEQHIFDRCDPINFIDRLTHRPAKYGGPVKILSLNALGDRAVPISTGVNLAHALGQLGPTPEAGLSRLQQLIERGVVKGLEDESGRFFDVEDFDADGPEVDDEALMPSPTISVADGVSGVRFYDVQRDHEWIAGYQRDGFHYGRHAQRLAAIYHRCGGRLISDEHYCLQSEECDLIQDIYLRDECPIPRLTHLTQDGEVKKTQLDE